MSDSRERFEAWWLEDAAPVMHASLLAKNEFNEYADFRAQCAYETWQAAERDALELAAKVCDTLEDEVKTLRKDAERWRTEIQLRNNPTVAIFFYGNEGRCSIHRNGVVIAQGDTYEKAIDAAVALSAASDGGKS